VDDLTSIFAVVLFFSGCVCLKLGEALARRGAR
jgi:hypothetical protein